MPEKPVIKHARLTLPHEVQVKNLLGAAVSTAVTVTAHSTVASAIPFLVTTKPTSANWQVQVFSYSYDGVVHVDAYRSDI